MRTSSPGFATVRTSVTASPWLTVNSGSDVVALGDRSESWDPAVDVAAERIITIDFKTLRAETGLDIGSRVRLAVGWFCERTRTREVAEYADLRLSQSEAEVKRALRVNLPGSSLAHAVELETRLVLVSAASESHAVAARMPGAVLWQHTHHLLLEGSGSRFPMEWADFSSSVYSDDAAWALDWDPHDLEGSTYGSVRLLLNHRHERVAALLRERPPSDAARVLWDALRFDIARQLITGALENETFIENPAMYPDGTLGATLRRMLSTYFPHDSVKTLKALVAQNPTRFETALQAGLSAFG